MAHFDAETTQPIATVRSLIRGRIEIVGQTESITVDAQRARIGRAEHCALVVDDPSVSAVHAEVRATPEGVHLLDLRSRNGTFVGGHRIVEVYLTGPTEFVCGLRTLRFVPLDPTALVEDGPEQAPTRFGGLVAATPAMRAALESLRKVAASDVSIVITGETGTGKELVARAVHLSSPRRGKRLVAINCASIPDNLVEDELFGHVKGAFTGADRDRDGVFVQADGGTLFFDEVAEMSPSMQAKLLRVLQERVVRPLGATRERAVNVRVLSASHASLEAQLNRGAFREDLFWRICHTTVHLPPLRERLAELPQLVRHILADLGHPEMPVDASALRLLQGRSWPGNVRELRNVLELALAGAPPGTLSLEDALRSAPRMPPRSQASLESLAGLQWKDAKHELKRRYFTPLHAKCRGNVTQMAKHAGLQRKAVREALRIIGLDAEGGEPDGGAK